MQIEAKDIVGFLSIKKSHSNDLMSIYDEGVVDGFNHVLDQISTKKLEVVIDREKLALQLHDYRIGGVGEGLISWYDYELADAIIKESKTDNGLVTIRSVE